MASRLSLSLLLLSVVFARLGSCIVVVADNGTKVRFEGGESKMTTMMTSSAVVKRSGHTHQRIDASPMMSHQQKMRNSIQNQLIRDDVKEVKTLKGEPSQIYGSAVGGSYGSHHHGGYHGSSHYGSTGHGIGPGPSYGGGHHPSGHGGGLLAPGGLYGSGGGGHHHVPYGDHPLDQPPYDHHHHHHDNHHSHDHHPHDIHHPHELQHQKQQAIKTLLIPLVGVALLGAAAAFVTNPILLQLGVITAGGYGYGRRRRDTTTPNNVETETEILRQKLNELAVLEKYMSEVPQAEAVTQEKRLLANYLSCSGITSGAGFTPENQTGIHCLERLTCELHRPDSVATELERHVMGIVTSEILLNEFVPMEVKNRVKNATSTGADSGSCSAFPCFELEATQT